MAYRNFAAIKLHITLKNRQAIYLLFAANSISGFATGISMIAIPWYFSNILDKPSLFGYIYFGVSFISLFWGMYAGTLIDRFNRLKVYIASSTVASVVMISLALAGYVIGDMPALLIAIAFGVTFLVYNIHYPNLYAFAQEVTEAKDYGRITSYLEIQGQLTNALAGAFAAILLVGTEGGKLNLFGFEFDVGFSIPRWELSEVFLLDGSTYIIAIILISLIRYVPVAVREPDHSGVMSRMKTGMRFLKDNPVIMIFGLASYAIFITILISVFFLSPVYINNHLKGDADVFAASEMYFALGSTVAGIAIRYIFRRTTTVMAIIILTSIAGGIYLYLMENTNIALFYFLFAFMGLCNAGTRILRMTYIFNHIPNYLIGRTNSVFNVFSVLFRMAFILVCSAPFFMRDDNIIFTYLIFGVFTFTSAGVLLYYYPRLVYSPQGGKV